MAFLSLGQSRTSKFMNGVVLVLLLVYAGSKLLDFYDVDPLAGAQDALVSATYHEVEIPERWVSEYTAESIQRLLAEYGNSSIFESIETSATKNGMGPELAVSVFQDEIMDRKEPGWVVRFEIATKNVGFEKSQKIVNELGMGFVEFANSRSQN